MVIPVRSWTGLLSTDETIGNTVELGVRHLASFLYAPTSGPVNILHSREIHTHIGMPAHINTVLYSFGWLAYC